MTHRHGFRDPQCVEIDPSVCLSPTVHGGSPDITNADGSIAGGLTRHIAGYGVAHDRADGGPRCEGYVSVDPHRADQSPIWTQTGTLAGGDLTLDPSVQCPDDGFHGYVRDGKWVSV